MSCSAKTNNQARGPRSEETKLKIKNSLTGGASKSGSLIKSRFEAAYYEAPITCAICEMTVPYNRRRGPTCSIECAVINQKQTCRASALQRGFGGYNSKKTEYRGIWFDSSWEVTLAKSFDANNISWTRPEKFGLSTGQHYTPDFYLPDFDVYLDPKGYVHPNRIVDTFERIKLFEQDYKTRCIIIDNKQNLTWSFVQGLLVPSS